MQTVLKISLGMTIYVYIYVKGGDVWARPSEGKET